VSYSGIPFEDDENLTSELSPPLWAVKHGKDKNQAYLDWLKLEYNQKMQSNARRATIQFQNSLLYEGLQYAGLFPHHRGDETEPLYAQPKGITPVDVNELFDTVQQRSSKSSKFNITTVAIPHSNEHEDREGAKIVGQLFETIKYLNNMKKLYREMTEDAVIFGYGFILPLWDKDRSDLDPRWVKAKKKAGKNKKAKKKA